MPAVCQHLRGSQLWDKTSTTMVFGTARWGRSGMWQSLKAREVSNGLWGGASAEVVYLQLRSLCSLPGLGREPWPHGTHGIAKLRMSYMINSGASRKEMPRFNGPGTPGPTRKCLGHVMCHCAFHGFLWLTGQSSPSVSQLTGKSSVKDSEPRIQTLYPALKDRRVGFPS